MSATMLYFVVPLTLITLAVALHREVRGVRHRRRKADT
jgi:hypothetical protein